MKQRKNVIGLLLKNRLMEQVGWNTLRRETRSRERRKYFGFALAVLLVIISGVAMMASFAYGNAILGMNDLTPVLALLLSTLITFIFTIFKTNGELFGFSDYDLLMSLPIPIRSIIHSRFLNMYIWNTGISALIMIPMGIVYASFANAPLLFYPMWMISVLAVALIPTTLASVLGALITACSSRFKHGNIISTVLTFLFVIILFSQTNQMNGMNFEIKDMVTNLENVDTSFFASLVPWITKSIHQIYPLAKLFDDGILHQDILSYFWYLGISLVWYYLFVFVLSLKYKKINTAITSHRSRSNYKMTQLHKKSMLIALYKKTILRILKSTIAATNLLVGCVLAMIAAIAITVIGPEKVIQGMEAEKDILPVIKSAIPFIVSAMICMSNTACISLALEGKNVWLVKSLPIPPKTLYDSYLLVNLSITIPTSLFCSFLLSYSLQLTLFEMLLAVITPLVFSVTAAIVGVFIGNRMAYYDWKDEVQLVKQSLMSLLGMLGGLIIVALCGVIVHIGIFPLSPMLLTWAVNVICILLSLILYQRESERPIKEE